MMSERKKITMPGSDEKFTLNQAVCAAKEAGLTYGKWVALNDPPKPKVKLPKVHKFPKNRIHTEYKLFE